MSGHYRNDINVGILCGLSLYETAAFFNDKIESLETYKHYGDIYITALMFVNKEGLWGKEQEIHRMYRFLRDGHIDV